MYYNFETLNCHEVIVYLRKSRSDDPNMTVEEVLETHEQMLEEYAEQHLNGKLQEKNIYREIASSETLAGRPEIQKILKEIESPRIKAILVVDVQRLSRGDLEDAGKLIKILRYTNTKVITPIRTYDLHDEYDRDAFKRELEKGNDYLEYFKKIQENGRKASVERGNYIGSIPPYGFNKTWIMEGKRKCPTLEENKAEADVVRMIFDMFVNQGMGRWHICYKLNELNIKPPHSDKWSPESIYDMLSNVHYIGKVKWNWRKTVNVIEDQEVIHTRPKNSEFLIFEGKHDGIVSEEIFQKAQELKGKNARCKHSTQIVNPLASLLYCRCGRAMAFRRYDGKDRKYKSDPRFLCMNQHYCHTGSVTCTEMYAKLYEVLEQCIENFEEKLKDSKNDSVKLQNNVIANIQKRLHELEEKEISQWEAQSDPDESKRMPHHIFEVLNKRLLAEKAELQQALRKAYESMPAPIDYREKIVSFQKALNMLEDNTISAEEKNKYLKTIIERIDYTRDKTYRMTKKQLETEGLEEGHIIRKAGWISPPFDIKVTLKF